MNIKRNRIAGLLFLAFLPLLVSGCETIKMPIDPVGAQFQLLPDAPLVGVNVVDTRPKEKIGFIGGCQIKAKKSELAAAGQKYLSKTLFQSGINPVQISGENFTNERSIEEIMRQLNAAGLIRIEITEARVSSIDLILDPPQYELTGRIVVYGQGGKVAMQDYIFGRETSQSLTAGGKGKALMRTLDNAIFSLQGNKRFQDALQSFKRKPELTVKLSQLSPPQSESTDPDIDGPGEPTAGKELVR